MRKMSRIRKPIGTIVFDLDGTLVDSAPDLADTLDELLVELGMTPIGLTKTRQLIGHGVDNLVRRGLESSGYSHDATKIGDCIERFHKLYSLNLLRKTIPYPGVGTVIKHLREDHWSLAVCTNKLERHAFQILRDLKLSAAFDLIVGPDTFGGAKPDPTILLQTIRTLGNENRLTIMVGDSEVDLATGAAAGIPVIAVTYGYAKTPFHAHDPELVVDSFYAIPATIKLLAQRDYKQPKASKNRFA